MRSFAVALLLASSLGCGGRPSTHSALNEGDDVPSEFQVVAMSAAALPAGFTVADRDPQGSAAVLAWWIDTDARPLRVENGVLWLRAVDSQQAECWILAHLFRHPLHENRWQVAEVFDADHVGRRVFDHPPSMDDAREFLSGAWCTLDPQNPCADDLETLRFGLCEAGWRNTIGSSPQLPIPLRSADESANRGRDLQGLGYILPADDG